MGTHLPPAGTAQVWTQGDTLYLHLTGPTGAGHTVEIPLDKMQPDLGLTGLPKPHQRGFAVLIDTLRAREMAKAHERAIGYAGTPPRHAVESACASDEKYAAWLKALGQGTRTLIPRPEKPKKLSKGEALLKELGL